MSDAHSARAHARLAPSAAHRWIHCSGSVKLSVGVEQKSGYWADEGTAAHTLAEFCLRNKLDPADFLDGHVNIRNGKVHKAEGEGDGIFTIDEEMVEGVSLYVDTVRGAIEPGDEFEFEAKLDLQNIPGMDFGTGDCVIYKVAARRLMIFDLKYGKGVAVEAEANPQLRTYMLGAARRYHNRGVDVVEGVIVQPRCPHPAGPVRRDVIDTVDLTEFRVTIEDAALKTMEENPPLHPGEWCRFCPAASFCTALKAEALRVAEMEFSDEPPAVAGLSADEMAAVLAKADILKAWFKRVEERAHQMAMDGTPPTGFKLVASRAFRRWVDEEAAKAKLLMVSGFADEDLLTTKLKSPAQVEKLLGRKRKDELDGLVVARSSGTILVPADDPRPSVKPGAEEEFA